MLKHVIRIGPDWLRLPLLCAIFPLHLVARALLDLRPARFGGHPNKRRLLCADYHLGLPVVLFWAAWDGHFIP